METLAMVLPQNQIDINGMPLITTFVYFSEITDAIKKLFIPSNYHAFKRNLLKYVPTLAYIIIYVKIKVNSN